MDILNHPEVILEAVLTMIGGVVAFVKLDGKSAVNRDKILDNVKAIEKLEARVEKMETRHDMVTTEVRAMLTSIQKSLANLEGKLSMRTNND